jgi:hypothetical protein
MVRVNHDLTPGRVMNESLSSKTCRLALWPTQHFIPLVRDSFLGVKQTGRKAVHWPPFSAEVTNNWCYTSTHTHTHTCLHGVWRNLTFIFVEVINFRLPVRENSYWRRLSEKNIKSAIRYAMTNTVFVIFWGFREN